MIEVELKLPIRDAEAVREDLIKMGFGSDGQIREEDCYFDNERRQIRENGEALRVRKITDLLTERSETVITYKGRKLDRISMSRKELETEVADGEICMQILEALGFGAVPPMVVKERQILKRNRVTACVDQVKNLGPFLELEIVIREDESKDQALEQIEQILRELGYALEDTTRNSYLSMLQKTEDA